VNLDENTPLVSSGLIDSMSLIDLLVKLEDLTHMRIPAGKGATQGSGHRGKNVCHRAAGREAAQ